MIRLQTLFIFGFASLLGIILRAVFVDTFYPNLYAPDFILILVVALSIRAPNVWGLLGAFTLGLICDLATGSFLGPNAAGFIIAFGFMSIAATKMYADRIPAFMLLTLIASVIKSVIFLLILAYYVKAVPFSAPIIWAVVVEGILTSVFAPLILKLLSWKQDQSYLVKASKRFS